MMTVSSNTFSVPHHAIGRPSSVIAAILFALRPYRDAGIGGEFSASDLALYVDALELVYPDMLRAEAALTEVEGSQNRAPAINTVILRRREEVRRNLLKTLAMTAALPPAAIEPQTGTN